MASPSDQASFAAMLAQSDMRVPEEQQPYLLEDISMLRLLDLLGRPATLAAEPR